MKPTLSPLLAGLLAASLFTLGGCDDDGKQPQPADSTDQSRSVSPSSEYSPAPSQPNQSPNLWDRVSDYSHQQSADFRLAVENAAAELQRGAVATGDHVGDLTESSRAKLRQANESLQTNLEALGDATAENWDAAKLKVRESYEQLRQAYQEPTR